MSKQQNRETAAIYSGVLWLAWVLAMMLAIALA